MFNEIGADKFVLLLAMVVFLVAAKRIVRARLVKRRPARPDRPRQAQCASNPASAEVPHASAKHPPRATIHHRVLELVELFAAAVFLIVGGAKLLGVPDMVKLFQAIGIGQWLRFVTGTIEVGCAVLLLVPVLSGASALVLWAVMAIASLIELFVLRRPPAAAMVCLAAHGYIAWGRRGWARRFVHAKHTAPGRRETGEVRKRRSRSGGQRLFSPVARKASLEPELRGVQRRFDHMNSAGEYFGGDRGSHNRKA
jgi:putative oxidoreductase